MTPNSGAKSGLFAEIDAQPLQRAAADTNAVRRSRSHARPRGSGTAAAVRRAARTRATSFSRMRSPSVVAAATACAAAELKSGSTVYGKLERAMHQRRQRDVAENDSRPLTCTRRPGTRSTEQDQRRRELARQLRRDASPSSALDRTLYGDRKLVAVETSAPNSPQRDHRAAPPDGGGGHRNRPRWSRRRAGRPTPGCSARPCRCLPMSMCAGFVVRARRKRPVSARPWSPSSRAR